MAADEPGREHSRGHGEERRSNGCQDGRPGPPGAGD